MHEAQIAATLAEAQRRWGRIDILHYNVGVSVSGGDASPTEITEDAFDRIQAINLRGCVMAGKHVLPIMRGQGGGVIINIASRSEEHTSELQSLMRNSYAVFCLKKKTK